MATNLYRGDRVVLADGRRATVLLSNPHIALVDVALDQPPVTVRCGEVARVDELTDADRAALAEWEAAIAAEHSRCLARRGGAA